MMLGKYIKQVFTGLTFIVSAPAMVTSLTGVALWSALPLTAQARVEYLDRVIALVDDDIVMESELKSRILTVTARLSAQGTPLPPQEVLEKRVLDQLILENIQMQMAEQAGLRVSDNQLNETMANIAKRNGLTLAQFQEALKSEGLTYREAREQIRREMIISRLQQRKVDRRVRVTDQEIQVFLASEEGRKRTAAEYYLGHILVALSENATPKEEAAAQQKVDEILARLKGGADFKQVAVELSDGRNALQGGVLGWRKETELPSIAADVIPSLALNQPSPAVRTSSGFHIVAVLDKKGGASYFVEQSHVRHILIKPSEIRTEDEARDIIFKLHDRIDQGEDFANLAKSNSDDPVSAINGGDMGWIGPGDTVPSFEDVMNHLDPGKVSEPVQTEYGWHIMEVLERRKEDVGVQLQENQARQVIHRRKYEEELVSWLREIRGESFVEIKDEAAAKAEEEARAKVEAEAAKKAAETDKATETESSGTQNSDD